MRDNPIRQNLMPIAASVVLLVGLVLIFVGLATLLLGRSHLGGLYSEIYEATMGGGAFMMLLGTWISRRWYKAQKSGD